MQELVAEGSKMIVARDEHPLSCRCDKSMFPASASSVASRVLKDRGAFTQH